MAEEKKRGRPPKKTVEESPEVQDSPIVSEEAVVEEKEVKPVPEEKPVEGEVQEESTEDERDIFDAIESGEVKVKRYWEACENCRYQFKSGVCKSCVEFEKAKAYIEGE